MGVAGFPERFCEWAAGNYFKLKVFAIRSQLVLKKNQSPVAVELSARLG
ncbi:MAG: hypothetical protein WCR74_10715 [Betaproteobacteria bacterium]